MSSGQRWLIVGGVVVLFNLLLLSVFGDNGLVEMVRLQEKEHSLAAKNEMLAKENLRLYRNIERLNRDPRYIESVARNELGMVRPDDMILLPVATAGREN